MFQKQSDESWRPETFASRSMTDVKRRYAQIEKEALAITWICERLADYLVGLQFHKHTGHKPLIYLFSADKSLDAVPPRIKSSGTATTVAATKALISGTLLLTSRSGKRDKASAVHSSARYL